MTLPETLEAFAQDEEKEWRILDGNMLYIGDVFVALLTRGTIKEIADAGNRTARRAKALRESLADMAQAFENGDHSRLSVDRIADKLAKALEEE